MKRWRLCCKRPTGSKMMIYKRQAALKSWSRLTGKVVNLSEFSFLPLLGRVCSTCHVHYLTIPPLWFHSDDDIYFSPKKVVIRSELGSRRCYDAFQTSRHAVKFLTVLRSLVWISRLEKYTRLDVARYGVGVTFSATACWACKYPCLNVESPPLFGLAGVLFSFVSVIPSLFTREWRFARC